jgi:alpha-tubulin suppressor-like RCC1 family protein
VTRGWLLGALCLAGCGRIDFAERAGGGDAAGPGDGDGAPALRWSHLVAYADQTCAVFLGRAYCWGANTNGQLGDGSTTPASMPREVALPTGHVDDLTEGQDHGCAIVEGGASCWGTFGAPAPVPVVLPGRATAISAGGDFVCALAGGGLCWGNNNSVGQLGTGTMAPHPAPAPVAWAGSPFVAIDAGDDHACTLDAAQQAHCWGHNDNGTLGTGSFNPSFALDPGTVIGNVSGLPQIAGWHACALAGGAVSCWGEGTAGELGDGANMDRATPQVVPSLASGVSALATGGGPADHDASCAIRGGEVACWGNGQFGRLGQGMGSAASTPVAVVGLPGPAISVALGYAHGCALLADDHIWCWGRGDAGQLGDSRMQDSLAPVRVVDP